MTLLQAISTLLISAVYMMPDSICPYLNSQQRVLLLTDATKGVYDTIPNQLGGRSWVEESSDQTVTFHLTSSLTMKLEASTDTITVTQTLCAPICSSTTRTFNNSWILLYETRSKWDAEQTDEEKEQIF